jgi:hypothetical protein
MRIPIFAWLILASGWAHAQNNIVAYEHWLDELDAVGQRTLVPITSGGTIAITAADISVDQLSLGLHRIHFRVKDDNSAWSSVLHRSFYISSGNSVALISGEYWFDQLDQTRVPFSFGQAENIDITIDPVATGLDLGLHRVHYRIKDSESQWSAVISRTFHLQSNEQVNLTLLRYWSDNASDYPNDMTTMAIEPEVEVWDVIDEVEFCTWQTTGNTNVYFQLKDNHAQWSSVIKRTFDIDLVATGPDVVGPITGPLMVSPNSTVTYSVPVVPGAANYTWTYPTGWTVIGGSSGDSITFETPDDFLNGQVTVTVSNACGQSGPSTIDVVLDDTGLNAVSVAEDIQIFPNPSTGQFILLPNNNAPIERLIIHNATGQLVQDIRPAQSDRLTMDLSDEANGLYTILISQENRQTKMKVMVQH